MARRPIIREAEAAQGAGTEVLDDHIAALDEPLEHALPVGMLEVERDAALVAVDGEVVGRDPADLRRHPVARLVTGAGHLDFTMSAP
jgi:hypothetical protein